ncbi:MAG: TrkA family potassium uptake protein [Clostridia bacterium]|nr:TrkA family potassium uptake protein [Clostridia bacterium]
MKSILLVGLGNFGKHLANQLNLLGHQVMGVDQDEDKVNDVLPLLTNAQIGDATNPAFVKSLGVGNFDVCMVTIGDDFQSSLETTSLLKEMGAKFVVARADREVHAKFLLKNGADEVVYPEKQVARWAAIRYSSDHIFDYIELEDGLAMFEVSVPRSWVGMSVGQIDIRKKYNITIMAIKQNGKMNVSITPDTILTENKTLLVLGEYKAIQKCFQI